MYIYAFPDEREIGSLLAPMIHELNLKRFRVIRKSTKDEYLMNLKGKLDDEVNLDDFPFYYEVKRDAEDAIDHA